MKTIAYIASELPKRSETFVYREIRELRRRGWRVVCVSLNEPSERVAGLEDLEQERLIVYPRVRSSLSLALSGVAAVGDALVPGESTGLSTRAKLFIQRGAARRLARELARRGVEHIHCHFAHAPTTVGMYAASVMGVPFSFTGHANDLFQRRSLLKRKLQRAAFINCISAWHQRFYVDIDPSCAAKCRIVRCGVDVDGWTTSPASAPAGGVLRVLTVCRLVEKKGVDMLLRGAAVARDSGTRLHVTVAGDGPQRHQLEAIAAESDLSDQVSFLGAVDNDRVRQLMAESDVFALPCRDDSSGDRDGIPVVLMEAMACGLPAISGDLPAIRELIAHEQSGLLVDGTSPSAIGAALQRLATDRSLASRLAAAGRARVVEEFSLSANVDRIEAALRAIG
jgi:glycosyltransferase involved in cell wall biosynthesis